jgi:hypothetical protein
VRFAVIGDYGLAGEAEAEVANLVKSWSPDFIITTGDNNYPSGSAATIDENVGQYYADYLAPYTGEFGSGSTENRFFPTLGNHDWDTPGAEPYFDYFTLPGNERYYDFTWGPVHLFALDSDSREPDGVSSSSPQAAWLERRLADSTAPWKIVYFHHAPYSSGIHGPVEWMRWPFKEWGADAVLSGHDHTYERLLVDGLYYIVNGVGGGPIYDFVEIDPASQFRYNDDHGALLVEATPAALTFQFFNRQGTLLDSVSIPSDLAAAPADNPAPAGVLDQTLAVLPENQAGLEAYSDLTRYTLQYTLNDPPDTFIGHARVDYANRETVSLDSLFFRLLPNGGKSYGDGSLTVSSAVVNGQAVELTQSSDGTSLELRLQQPLPPSGSVQVDLDFSGIVPNDFGDGSSGYGIYNYYAGVLTMANAYPLLAVYDEDGWNLDPVSFLGDSVYSEAAFYTVDVTAPANLVVAATGTETDRQAQGAAMSYRFVSGPARDFFLTASPEFQVFSESVNGTQVNSYYLPDDAAGARAALSIAAESLQAFNEQFGPYPYAELDLVEVPLSFAGGVEYPGLVLLSQNTYDESDGLEFEVTTSHEVAHQWWYGLVGNDVFEDPWLDEALATYSSALYFEQARGEDAYQGYVRFLEETVERVLSEGQDHRVTESLGYFENLERPGLYSVVVYLKGALFFDEVRQEIGEAAFFAALQRYYQDQMYAVARPADLLAAFETAAGHSLEALYQEWLYSP